MPEVEEREACIFAGFNWREWLGLERADRVDAVAHYRLHHLIEQHAHDASYQDSKRQIDRSRAERGAPPPRTRPRSRR